MNIPKQSGGINTPSDERRSNRINLPVFTREEIGLGDVIKKITTSVGFTPCGGCQRRAEALNRWIVFSPSTKK